MMTPAHSNISSISAAEPGALSDVGCGVNFGPLLGSSHIPGSSSFTEGGPAAFPSSRFQNQQPGAVEVEDVDQEDTSTTLQQERQKTPSTKFPEPFVVNWFTVLSTIFAVSRRASYEEVHATSFKIAMSMDLYCICFLY